MLNGQVYVKIYEDSIHIKTQAVIFLMKLPDLQRFIVSEFKFGDYTSIKFSYTICDFETAQFLSTINYPLGKLRYNYFEYRLNEIVQSYGGKKR